MRALPPPTERQVQRSILSMCGTCFPGVFITAIPNGAHLAGNDHQRKIQGGCLVGDGMKKGFPDLLCLWHPWKGCLIEVKRPKLGIMSEAQIAVHVLLTALEWPVQTVTSQDEAYTFLRACGAPCRGELRAVA